MNLRRRLRRALVIVLYWPFVALITMRSLWFLFRHPRRVLFENEEPDAHAESLAYRGNSGQFAGTVATVLVDRAAIASSLPPELTVIDTDELPDWLRERDDHPVIMLIGKQEKLGRRKRLLGRYRTVPLFRPYLETFVAVPFLKPTASDGPCPCFHFARIPCGALWPTELGNLCMGYPKIQCPMQMSVQDGVQHYSIWEEAGNKVWLSAQTDLRDPVALDPSRDSLNKVVAMMSQPLALIKDGEIRFFRFDLRLEAATSKAVPAVVTIHPGFLPFVTERKDFSLSKITDAEFGAFVTETTFLNRELETTPA